MFYYEEFPCHELLSPIIENYWVKKASLVEPMHFEYLTPMFQGLIFNIHRIDEYIRFDEREVNLNHKAYFFGQSLSPRLSISNNYHIDIIGVKFRNMGLYKLTGIEMKHFTDQVIDAESIWGGELRTLCERLSEQKEPIGAIRLVDGFLQGKLRAGKGKEHRSCILHAMDLLESTRCKIDVRALQKSTCTSRKTLERAFMAEVGMNPKMYGRILRYNQAKAFLETGKGKDWWEAISEFGFYDQPHFINEFKSFSGKTPRQYFNALKALEEDQGGALGALG